MKRHLAYEALVLLGVIALLTFICRLWILLMLVILGMIIATIRMLFLSVKKTEAAEPTKAATRRRKPPQTEKDLITLAYGVMQKRITQLVKEEFAEAKWVWDEPNAKQRIENFDEVHILLNGAGGYRRAKVNIANLQAVSLDYGTGVSEAEETAQTSEPLQGAKNPDNQEAQTVDYQLLAFEWVEAHIMQLNERCNDAVGQNCKELILTAEELPVQGSWPDIVRELKRAEICDVECVTNGIKINILQ